MRMTFSNGNMLTAHTLVDVALARGCESPDRVGWRYVTYHSADRIEEVPLTYGELLDSARAIAAYLQQSCNHGDRVLILCQPGVHYICSFFGCQLAGMVAVPAYPPRNEKHMQRLQTIVEDSGAAAILAPSTMYERIIGWSGSVDAIPPVKVIEEIKPSSAVNWRDPQLRPDDLAFLQYTSGTTGAAKGVMVSQRSVLVNLAAITSRWQLTGQDIGVCWLPPFHDMGLMCGLLLPIYCAFPAYLMSPAAFVQRPARWTNMLSEVRATISVAPNFAYELAVDAVNATTHPAHDLTSLRVAVNGAEQVRTATLARFAEAFAPFGFDAMSANPSYGMAETVLMATSATSRRLPRIARYAAQGDVHHIEPAPSNPAEMRAQSGFCVSCGTVIDGHDLKIVDPKTGVERGAGEVGEIWLSGPSVADGYWNKPELSTEVFRARIAASPEGPNYLRTGDLGAVIEGELYVLGRIKEMVIIRGRNHYAQDIEDCASRADGLLGHDRTIAFGVERATGEALILVHELTRTVLRDFDAASLAQAMRRELLEAHEIQPSEIVFVKPASLPRTTSGKLQRGRTRDLFLANELLEVARWDAAAGSYMSSELLLSLTAASVDVRRSLLVTFLQGELKDVLGITVPPDPMMGFFDLGMDSLKAIEFRDRLACAFGADLTMHDTMAFDYPSLDRLANSILEVLNAKKVLPEEMPTPGSEHEKSIEDLITELSAKV